MPSKLKDFLQSDKEMAEIYSQKYMGKRLGSMSGIEFSGSMKGLMAKFTAIAGWRVPDTDGGEAYEAVFNDQLRKYVLETCGDLTLGELEYAVRRYGVDMSDWGKPMHLGLIDPCVSQYKIQREELSKVEEQAVIDQKMPKKEELPAGPVDWSEEWDKVMYAAKIGQIRNCWITVDLYDWLIKTGRMPINDPAQDAADKWEVVKQCAKQYLEDIKDALISGSGIEPPYEIKRRITLLENKERPIWKKDTAIMSTLTIMAKKEMVRQLAIIECINQEQ
jgi:hypothetical protein